MSSDISSVLLVTCISILFQGERRLYSGWFLNQFQKLLESLDEGFEVMDEELADEQWEMIAPLLPKHITPSGK
jgi:hypothetical protein